MVQGPSSFAEAISAAEKLAQTERLVAHHDRIKTLSGRMKAGRVTQEDEAELRAMLAEFPNEPPVKAAILLVGREVIALLKSSQGDTPYPGTPTLSRQGNPGPQETVAGNPNRPASAPIRPVRVEETREDWTNGLPEESVRSFRNIDNTSPGATIQGKARGAAPKPVEAKQAVNAPLVYTRLQYMASDTEKLKSGMELLIRNTQALGVFCKYLDEKPDFTPHDDQMGKALLERVPKNALGKFPMLLRKMDLGILGWENYEGMKKEGYELKKFIAKGGMGAVYVARQHGVDRDVAVKIITDPDRDPYREARLLGKIQTKVPVVVPIFVGGKIGMYSYLVMPLLKGVSDLSQILKMILEGEKLGKEERFLTCLKMTESVEAMHAAGIIHRDIKLANFLVKGLKKGNVDELHVEVELLGADFGVAREDTEEEKARDKEYNDDGSPKIFGTPLYMPKEQASSEELDSSCDVYALAVSQYQFLTGSLPYPEKRVASSIGIMSHKMMKEGSDIDENDPKLVTLGIPLKLRRMLSRATDQSDRSNRPSAAELKEEWEKFVHTFTADFKESEEKEREVTVAQRTSTYRGRIAKIFGALLVAGAIGGALYVPHARKQTRNEEFMRAHVDNSGKIDDLIRAMNRVEVVRLLDEEITKVTNNVDLSEERKNELLAALNCKKNYINGAWAFHLGKVDDARREFAIVNASLLNPEEAQSFAEMTRILSTLEETLAGIQTDIATICAIDDITVFQAVIDRLKSASLQGDENAMSKILEIMRYLRNHPPAVYRQVGRRPNSTRITNANELEREPAWVRYRDKKRAVDRVIVQDLYRTVVDEIQNPGELEYLERDFKEFLDVKKMKLQDLLSEGKFDEYGSEMIKILRYFHCLNVWITEKDLLEIPSVPNTATFLSTYLSDILMQASGNLPVPPDSHKSRLLQDIRETFKDEHADALISELAEQYLGAH